MFKNDWLISAVVLNLALASAAFAQGGDGGHFNGPTLAPISIPVSVERGISVRVAEAALSRCIIGDREKAGLMGSLAKKLIRASNVQNLKFYGMPEIDESAGKIGFLESTSSISASFRNDQWTRNGLELFGNGLFIISEYNNMFTTELQADSFLPRIEFDSLDKDFAYDELGNFAIQQSYLKGARLVLPPNWNQPVTFINKATHHASALTLDLSDTVECIRAEISKSAAN